MKGSIVILGWGGARGRGVLGVEGARGRGIHCPRGGEDFFDFLLVSFPHKQEIFNRWIRLEYMVYLAFFVFL